jgi:hypothetical protein
MMTVCPTRSASFAITTRAVASDAPPGGNGTMTVTVRSGYSAACAGAAKIAAKIAAEIAAKIAATMSAGTLNGCMPPSCPERDFALWPTLSPKRPTVARQAEKPARKRA